MGNRTFKAGDWVVFTTTKFSSVPGRRATNIRPMSHGDGYSYTVDKFWVVAQSLENNRLILQTRRGKRHTVCRSDFRLRSASVLERFRERARYREIERGIRVH